jgi:hypothetical protein
MCAAPLDIARVIAPPQLAFSCVPVFTGEPTFHPSGGTLRAMPRYHFTVHDGNWNEDPDGSTLDNDEAAHREALLIAHDLAKGRESDPKTLTIQVTEGERLVWIVQWPPP